MDHIHIELLINQTYDRFLAYQIDKLKLKVILYAISDTKQLQLVSDVLLGRTYRYDLKI